MGSAKEDTLPPWQRCPLEAMLTRPMHQATQGPARYGRCRPQTSGFLQPPLAVGAYCFLVCAELPAAVGAPSPVTLRPRLGAAWVSFSTGSVSAPSPAAP